MTLAVLLPAAPAPGLCADGVALADRLAEQLRAAGADEVIVTADLAEVARLAGCGEPVLLCGDDLVAHTAVLRHVATSPAGPTVALVLPEGPADAVPLREERGLVTAVGAPPTESSGVFGGLLRVGGADLPALAAAALALAAEPPTGDPTAARTGDPTAAATGGATAPAGGVTAPAEDAAAPTGGVTASTGTLGAAPLDRLLARLAGAGVTVSAHRLRLLVARRVADPAGLAAAEAEVAAVDSDAAELRLSVKERDDFFTTYFVSSWSPWLTRLAARLRLDPSTVTAVSVLVAVAAAVLFGLGGRPALVTGAVLLYLGFVLDCVDGQLARYTRRFSAFGGWLDTIADRAKEYLVYAGLAVGVERAGLGDGWALGIAAIMLQTVRHMTDTWYGALHDEAARRPRPTGGSGGLGDRLSRVSTRVQADTGSLSYWLKRIVVFPIGERWALIALTVALFNPLVSLLAVLAWGALAIAYTLALRSLRARSMRVPVLTTVDTALHRDDGPVARLLGRVGRRLPFGPLPRAALAALAAGGALWAVSTGRAGLAGPLVAGAVLLLAAGTGSGATHAGPLDWLVPAALRAAEYLFVVAVGVSAQAPPALIFALVFALTLHHYDLTARLEKRAAPRPLHALASGWDGRVLLLCAAVALSVVDVAMAVLTAYLLLLFAVGSIAGWSAARPRRVPHEVAERALTPAGGAPERRI